MTIADITNGEAGSSVRTKINEAFGQVNMIKAWGRVDMGGGTPTLVSSYNVASIGDLAVGRFSVTFTDALANTDYGVLTNSVGLVGVRSVHAAVEQGSIATTGFNISVVKNDDSGLLDDDIITFMVLG